MITFESLVVGSLDLHPIYLQGRRVKFVYEGHRVKVMATGGKGGKSLLPQCKTLSGHNLSSVKHRAMRFACSVGFSAMWQIEWCDRHLCHVK